MIEYLKELPDNLSPLEKMLLLDQRFFLSDHNLIYTDKMSMANGVEVRVPFLDDSLVKLASNIPDNLKCRNFQAKWVLKKAMEPYLPRDIIYRSKTGFGLPLRNLLNNELKEFMYEVLSSESIKNRGILRKCGKKINYIKRNWC